MPEQLSVFIVDDEHLARERIKRLLADTEGVIVVGEAENGEVAIPAINNSKPDLVFLDIRMPGIDGLEVADAISRHTPPPAIIFCTAYDEYAIEAFQYSAAAYLLKPARKEDLLGALGRATKLSQAQLSQIQSTQNQNASLPAFVAQTWQGLERIPFEDIYYFQADQKYVTVVHKGGETLTDHTLKEIENRFQDAIFRSHRNTLVNSAHVQALKKEGAGQYALELTNQHTVPVSRRHIQEAKTMLDSI